MAEGRGEGREEERGERREEGGCETGAILCRTVEQSTGGRRNWQEVKQEVEPHHSTVR